MRRGLRLALGIVDGVVAATAVGGGIALAAGAEDEHLGRALLERTPFRSYRVPGMLLIGLVGGSATAATGAVVRDPLEGARLSILAGGVLAAWIASEIVILDQSRAPTPTEGVYLGLAGSMAALGVLLLRTTRER